MDPSADDPPPLPVPPLPSVPPVDPFREPLTNAAEAERAEVRRLIDAGAASPEDLRTLAEKMKAQRLVEERAWRDKVKPELMASKKFRLSALRRDAPEGQSEQRRFFVVTGLSVLAVTVLLTVSSASWVVILFLLVGLLAYAWVLGNRPSAEDVPPTGSATIEEGPGDDPSDGSPET